MTDLRKASEMALEAMERRNSVNYEYKVYLQDAIDALRQALAQPEQEPEHPLDIYERAYFAGKQDGIDEALAQHEKKWVGLTDKDFQYQQPAEVLTMKYTEALLKERNI